MFGLGPLEVLVLLLPVVGLGVLVAAVLRAVRRGTGSTDLEVAREWRLVLAARSIGVVVGVALAVLTWLAGSVGRGPMLSLAVFGLCVLVGTAVGETLVRPRSRGDVRSASLTPRRVRDHLPVATTVLVAALTAAATVTLVLTTLTADRDERGRMRELSCSTPDFGSTHGPYPGAYYSVPLAVVLALVLIAAAYAAHQVVQRPRGMARTEAGEDLLRRRSLDVIVAATGIAVGAPLVGVALTAGIALRSLGTAQPSCAAGWMDGVGTALLVLALAALLITLGCIGRLLTPVRVRVAADEPVAR